MAKELNEQQQAVADYLAEIGVTYSVLLVGPTKRDGWECDQWSPIFSRGSDREGRQIETPYFTGTGHRKPVRPMPPDIARLNPNSLARVGWEKALVRPVAPCAADVLYSLLMDASSAEQNFRDWCADYGYDSDSRKALATYEGCCEILFKVRAVFSVAEREKLGELLEDY